MELYMGRRWRCHQRYDVSGRCAPVRASSAAAWDRYCWLIGNHVEIPAKVASGILILLVDAATDGAERDSSISIRLDMTIKSRYPPSEASWSDNLRTTPRYHASPHRIAAACHTSLHRRIKNAKASYYSSNGYIKRTLLAEMQRYPQFRSKSSCSFLFNLSFSLLSLVSIQVDWSQDPQCSYSLLLSLCSIECGAVSRIRSGHLSTSRLSTWCCKVRQSRLETNSSQMVWC